MAEESLQIYKSLFSTTETLESSCGKEERGEGSNNKASKLRNKSNKTLVLDLCHYKMR